MKFFEDTVLQACKRRHSVCGDHYLCERTADATSIVLCDGVGSGVYASTAAIACASRLMELIRSGWPPRVAAERVAESMNRARTEEMPFSAFSIARILPGGQFTVYSYENPGPVWIRGGLAQALPTQYIALKYEMIAECSGMLMEGDRLLLCTDGVTHAGLGGGYAVGWELSGLVGEINAFLREGGEPDRLLSRVMRTIQNISGGVLGDDTSLALVECRSAKQLTVLTGPPKHRADDRRVAMLLANADGKKAVCGSSTAEITARELGRKARMVSMDVSLGTPPEYEMEGIDLITEGAVTLNQAMNLLEERIDLSVQDTAVFKLCRLFLEADSISFLVGRGLNAEQAQDPLLRQLGIKPRQRVVEALASALRERGKLVTVQNF